MIDRQLQPAVDSTIYGALATNDNPTSEAAVLGDPDVWQHYEYENPASSGEMLLKVWKHDDQKLGGYSTALYIVK